MDRPTYLFNLLSVSSALAACGALGDSRAKTAFEALKTLLIETYKVENLDMLDRAREDPSAAKVIRSSFAGVIDTIPDITIKDLKLCAERLRNEIDALPGRATAPFAKELAALRAARDPFKA